MYPFLSHGMAGVLGYEKVLDCESLVESYTSLQ